MLSVCEVGETMRQKWMQMNSLIRSKARILWIDLRTYKVNKRAERLQSEPVRSIKKLIGLVRRNHGKTKMLKHSIVCQIKTRISQGWSGRITWLWDGNKDRFLAASDNLRIDSISQSRSTKPWKSRRLIVRTCARGNFIDAQRLEHFSFGKRCDWHYHHPVQMWLSQYYKNGWLEMATLLLASGVHFANSFFIPHNNRISCHTDLLSPPLTSWLANFVSVRLTFTLTRTVCRPDNLV